MAIELKKFQEEYKKIQASMTGPFGEWKSVGDSQGNTRKLLEGAKLAIGDRIGELKQKGAQGVKLADFAADSQVKAALETAKKSLTKYKAMEARKKAAVEVFKKIHHSLVDLANRIDKEAADRKKKLFEPKSLPDMIKLGKTVRDEANESGGLKSQTVKDISEIKVKDGEVEAWFWGAVELEVKKSAAIRANAAVSELLEMFKPRLMKLRSDRVSSLAKEIEGICLAAANAKKTGDSQGAKNTFKHALPMCDEMHGIVEKYNHAFKSNKSFLEQNPDSQTIVQFVSFMASTENRALHAVKSTQSMVQ